MSSDKWEKWECPICFEENFIFDPNYDFLWTKYYGEEIKVECDKCGASGFITIEEETSRYLGADYDDFIEVEEYKGAIK